MPTDPSLLESGVHYAVNLDREWSTASPFTRPLEAIWVGPHFQVINPERPEETFECSYRDCSKLGRWDAPVMIGSSKTWSQLAAHALGQVLRQHALVERLAKVGITRQPEPYIWTQGMPNAVKRSMVLNFDELDDLLTRAGV